MMPIMELKELKLDRMELEKLEKLEELKREIGNAKGGPSILSLINPGNTIL